MRRLKDKRYDRESAAEPPAIHFNYNYLLGMLKFAQVSPEPIPFTANFERTFRDIDEQSNFFHDVAQEMAGFVQAKVDRRAQALAERQNALATADQMEADGPPDPKQVAAWFNQIQQLRDQADALQEERQRLAEEIDAYEGFNRLIVANMVRLVDGHRDRIAVLRRLAPGKIKGVLLSDESIITYSVYEEAAQRVFAPLVVAWRDAACR